MKAWKLKDLNRRFAASVPHSVTPYLDELNRCASAMVLRYGLDCDWEIARIFAWNHFYERYKSKSEANRMTALYLDYLEAKAAFADHEMGADRM